MPSREKREARVYCLQVWGGSSPNFVVLRHEMHKARKNNIEKY